MLLRQVPVGGQAGAGYQLAAADGGGELIDHLLVTGAGHGGCIQDNILIVLNMGE